MVSRLENLNSHFGDQKADVIIIGAGIAGLSTAVNLKKKGFGEVVVVDQLGKMGSLAKASNVNCGIVCSPAVYSPSEMYMEMLTRTQRTVRNIPYVQFRQTGCMFPCNNEDQV